MAARCLNDDTRCEVCGIPQRIIRILARRGWGWLLGEERANRHLTCDHINPEAGSEMSNLRPLCFACNSLRRDEHYTDEELLVVIRNKWSWRFGQRIAKLYWLNTHIVDGVAVGGTLFRSKSHERAERRARGEGKDITAVYSTGA